MPEAAPRYADLSRAAAHELATVEQYLRAREFVSDVEMTAHDSSARVYFDTWEPNEHSRGTTKAAVVTQLVESDHWRPVTIHDDQERENGLLASAVSIARETDDA